MKLESNLPERPGLLHAMPVFDIFALLLLFFLLGSSFVLQSGVRVDPPPSRFQLERFEETLVVSLVTGAADALPSIYFGRELVTAAELTERLAIIRQDGKAAQVVVLLRSDQFTPVIFEREIAESILDLGFRLALVGRLPDGDEESKPDQE
jgi:biopolymer transport protein ExbD